MFRSLFIGFLILSALTSKGAGFQINQNISHISSDMLLELFNAAVAHADKQAELSCTDPDRAFLSNHCVSESTIESLLRPIRQERPVAFTKQDDNNNCSNSQCADVNLKHKHFCSDEVIFCATGLSPPCCAMDSRKE